MILVVTMSMLFGATVRLHIVPISESHSSLGVIQGLKVVVVIAVNDVALWHHLQVSAHTVVAGTCVITEVNDTALIGALIRRLDSGEAEFMGDVASYNLHNLAKINKIKREQQEIMVKSYKPMKHLLDGGHNYRIIVTQDTLAIIR